MTDAIAPFNDPPLDVEIGLNYLSSIWAGENGTLFEYSGDLSENTETQYDNLIWLDARPKPSWSFIVENNAWAYSVYRFATYERYYVPTMRAALIHLPSQISAKQDAITPGAHVAAVAADLPTDLNVVTTLLGTLTGEVNDTNERVNEIAVALNTLLSRLEAQGLLEDA